MGDDWTEIGDWTGLDYTPPPNPQSDVLPLTLQAGEGEGRRSLSTQHVSFCTTATLGKGGERGGGTTGENNI